MLSLCHMQDTTCTAMQVVITDMFDARPCVFWPFLQRKFVFVQTHSSGLL